MPRSWVVGSIREVAIETLNLFDDSEYGRFLEVLNEIQATDLLQEFQSGLSRADDDVRDMAMIWAEKSI